MDGSLVNDEPHKEFLYTLPSGKTIAVEATNGFIADYKFQEKYGYWPYLLEHGRNIEND